MEEKLSPAKELVVRVHEMAKKHRYTYHEEPETVYLTKKDEITLVVATPDDVGDEHVTNTVLFGVRAAYTTFLGMNVIWGAPETLVGEPTDGE